jgi:hypothetical protein
LVTKRTAVFTDTGGDSVTGRVAGEDLSYSGVQERTIRKLMTRSSVISGAFFVQDAGDHVARSM